MQQGDASLERQDVPLEIDEAAARLDMTSARLRAWSERFGWPQPDEAGCYPASEIEVLADTIEHSVSISSAIARARAESERPSAAPRRARGGSVVTFAGRS